jgi:hypothetical protein
MTVPEQIVKERERMEFLSRMLIKSLECDELIIMTLTHDKSGNMENSVGGFHAFCSSTETVKSMLENSYLATLKHEKGEFGVIDETR